MLSMKKTYFGPVFICLSTFVPFALSLNGMGYVKTSNLTTTNWNAAITTTYHDVSLTLVECASLCYYQINMVSGGQCNAFVHSVQDYSCTLANVGFLEDQQPHLTYTVSFHWNLNQRAFLKRTHF